MPRTKGAKFVEYFGPLLDALRELVDGEKLLDMFEKLELGLSPRMIYDVDETFFDEFRE